jgi:hypothetical protein
MSRDEYLRALEAASREYEQLAAERHRLDARLSELAQTIGTLCRLCGLVPTVPWGLTDACRTVVRTAASPMTAADVRDRLAVIGYDLGIYANALAAIHTTLKRLTEAGELRIGPAAGSGKAGYVWLRGPNVATLSVDNAWIAREIQKSQARRRKRG